MKWREQNIRAVIQGLAEENMLASRALFEVSEIVFTESVPTMAVSLEKHPRLMINLQFCNDHLESEEDVCCVLLHEFLHVLLYHTMKYDTSSPLLNLALDAVINAIIHRSFGLKYSRFFTRFYKWDQWSPEILLRPAAEDKFFLLNTELRPTWDKVQEGKICADDLFELLQYLQSRKLFKTGMNVIFLGNHEKRGEISKEAQEILDGILKKMDGTKIWSKSKLAGIGYALDHETRIVEQFRQNKWIRDTRKLIRQCLVTDPGKRDSLRPSLQRLPVLTSRDVRSLAKYRFSGLIPLSDNEVQVKKETERASVYLDVSGSMEDEMKNLLSLLWEFRSYLKMPFNTFSDNVTEARFRNRQALLETSGGTRIESVFEHIRDHKIKKALVITDGYVGPITPKMTRSLDIKNIRFLVSADGNSGEIGKAGFCYSQLKKLTTQQV
jgi:hypothetical protein